jgi:hypothetical protein
LQQRLLWGRGERRTRRRRERGTEVSGDKVAVCLVQPKVAVTTGVVRRQKTIDILSSGMSLRRIPVAIFGGGVVGGGVASILRQRADLFAQRGLEFQLKYLVVRDTSKPRDFDVPSTTEVTSNHDRVLADDSIGIVVEVMGGEAARRVVFESATRGKHVVTANKALLAAHLPEIISAFPMDRRPRLGFEASVAGGIPIIRAAQQSLSPDSVQSVAGILNGTTNYMLTQGFSEAGSYAGALALAQVRKDKRGSGKCRPGDGVCRLLLRPGRP